MNERQEEIAIRLRELLIVKLRLPMEPAEISFDINLFGEGLGMDSVDVLTFISAIDTEYGISLTSEHRDYLQNLSTLSEYIMLRLDEK